MTRTARRRTLRLESLEGRKLMAAGPSLSPEAAETIALTNMARQNPAAIAQWALNEPGIQDTLTYYGVNSGKFVSDMKAIPARPPLAWNQDLNHAAQSQSDYEAQVGQQTHVGANGADLGTRLNAAGYTGASSAAENTYAFASDADNAIRSFLIDWGVADLGHRVNMLQPNAQAPSFTEVGVGFTRTSNKGLGPEVVTMDFGRHDATKPYLLGFAYGQDADGYYKAGEGRGGVQVQITPVDGHGNPTGGSQTVTTDSSGAYETQLAPGTYQVAATLNGTLVHGTTISIGSDNVEYDIKMNGAWDTPPPPPTVTPATQVVQSPTAAPAPQVVQASTSTPAPSPAAAPEAPSDKGDGNAPASSPTTTAAPVAPISTPPDVLAQAIAEFGDISLSGLKAYDNIDFSSIQAFSGQA